MIRNILFFLLFLGLFQFATAAFYVVSNIAEDNAEFRSIQSAIEHASSYDTVYVKGSSVNYGNVLLEKPITLIGEGFYDEKVGGHTSKITRVLLTSNPYRRTISSGSKIIGFEFAYFPGERPNIVTVDHKSSPIEDVTLERNWLWFIQIVGNAKNWQISNNIIWGWLNGGATNDNPKTGATKFLLSNNIVNSIIGFSYGENVIRNNIVLGRLTNIQYVEIFDNIFILDDFIFQDVYSCILRNNVSKNDTVFSKECFKPPNSFEARNICNGKSNRSFNNRVGVDPEFLYWPVDDIKGGEVFELTNTSAIKNSGINGRDPGIFDGPYPFPVNAFLNKDIVDPFPYFVTFVK